MRKDIFVLMTVSGVVVDVESDITFVVLENRHENRELRIPIGEAEARAIALALNKEHHERPQTHDLYLSTLRAFGQEVKSLDITSVRDGVFYAKLIISAEDDVTGLQPLSTDCRPSDGIALCLKSGAAIFVSKKVLDEMAETKLEVFGTTLKLKKKTKENRNIAIPVDKEFRDFLSKVKPCDFGGRI